MKVAFFGLGSIGQRHARLLQRMYGAQIVAVRTRLGQQPVRVDGIREVAMADLERQAVDAAFVTNPTDLHVRTAVECLRAGIRRIFIEKPLDCDVKRIRRLRRAAGSARLFVGYPLAFHPVVEALRRVLRGRRVIHVRMVCSSWLPDWRPRQDYRRSYSADARRGGGVLLDLSHELDLLEVLTGSTVALVEGRLRRSGLLDIRAEDVADLVVTLKSGGGANVHLDFCSRRRQRTVQVDVAGGHFEADLLEGRLSGGGRERRWRPEPDGVLEAEIRHFWSADPGDLRRDFERKAALTERLLEFRRRHAP